MPYHYGRLIDHVHLRVRDLNASRSFYKAALEALEKLEAFADGEGCFYADELYVDRAESEVSRVHLAFQATSAEQVVRFHAMTLAAGGTSNGAPGPRSYHSSYFAAFVLDPDGNNIEAVFHGPNSRSAPSVEVQKLTKSAA